MYSVRFSYKRRGNIWIPIIPITIFAPVAFSEKLNVGFNLLGRKGIFEEFDEVVFIEKQKQVEFRK
ncbi:MAG: hypothetical protein COT45_04970 [bacterium (Candidatus Stahlbacteria) CG08_land_8_20_14_0_20_40_26]|nr:MAG: hypothetical protein COT45_04970 [bacterium (Candidatus Stahlbacteria) CG08_land_8_20_14_0_20_40_26]